MANEFQHDSVGGELSRAEWEAIGTHVFDSQATGDMLIASSATQLSRLPIGIANQVPHVAGGTLVYASTLAGLTLTSPNINGVIGTTGLTIPAVIFSGDNTWNVAQTGVTLTSPTINGTIATTGLTVPNFTLAGTRIILSAGTIMIQAEGDIDDYLTIGTNAENVPTLYGTGAYLRIGDAATTQYGLNSEDDLMVSGELEAYTLFVGDTNWNVKIENDKAAIYFGDRTNSWDALIKFNSTSFNVEVRNGADTIFWPFRAGEASFSAIIINADTGAIRGTNVNTDFYDLAARDIDGAATVPVARIVNANDPYIGFGGTQEFKFYNSGVADFGGRVTTISYHEWTEMAAPGAGAANTARIYALEDGGGLTDLCAVFQDGSIDVFAQEVTDPSSPIFTYPDNTKLELVMRRPDKITTQFVAVFPDGAEFTMREILHPDRRE